MAVKKTTANNKKGIEQIVEPQKPIEIEKPSFGGRSSMERMMENLTPPSMGMMDGILGGPGPNPIGEIMKRVLGPQSETKSNKLKITGKIGESHIDIELVDEITLRMAQQIIDKKLSEIGPTTTV